MNEIELSQDINVITTEINTHKQIAGQSIFEIGKRLKHVKENQLTHGSFGVWLETIDMSNQQASRYIKVYEEIPQDENSHVGKMGFRAMYEIATMPEEEREKEHVTSKGETKTVDEMTVRELQEAKRMLKQTEEEKNNIKNQMKQVKESEQIAINQLESERMKKDRVVEKEVVKEIDKTDYETIKKLERQINIMKQNNENISQKEKEVKLLKLDANKSVLKTKISINEFLQEVSFTSYRRGAIASSSDGTKEQLREGIEDLKNFIKEMEMALYGTIQ